MTHNLQIDNIKNEYFQANVVFTCPREFLSGEKEDFRLSRHALYGLLKDENILTESLSSVTKDDFEIIDFDHLKNRPQIKVSLSHTKNAGAAAISKSPMLLGLGIDIENKNREYKPGIEKFFLLDSDDKNLGPLHLWCAKEACYKAVYPHYKGEKVLVIKDFEITGNQFKMTSNPQISGQILFFEENDHLVALALYFNPLF